MKWGGTWLSYGSCVTIEATANTLFHRRGPFCPELRMRRMNALETRRQTHSGFYRHYTQTSAKFQILLKMLNFHECFIISNGLYMAHDNLLGICHQLKIRHLYGTFNFSTQCICMGIGSLFVLRVSLFSWKGAPSTKHKHIYGSGNCRIWLLWDVHGAYCKVVHVHPVTATNTP